jgi:hypothetical protein
MSCRLGAGKVCSYEVISFKKGNPIAAGKNNNNSYYYYYYYYFTRGTFLLINIAISGDRNMIKTKNRKYLNIPYNRNTAQVECKKTEVIPVVIGANGTISESFRKYLSNIPGKRNIKEIEKTVTFAHR